MGFAFCEHTLGRIRAAVGFLPTADAPHLSLGILEKVEQNNLTRDVLAAPCGLSKLSRAVHQIGLGEEELQYLAIGSTAIAFTAPGNCILKLSRPHMGDIHATKLDELRLLLPAPIRTASFHVPRTQSELTNGAVPDEIVKVELEPKLLLSQDVRRMHENGRTDLPADIGALRMEYTIALREAFIRRGFLPTDLMSNNIGFLTHTDGRPVIFEMDGRQHMVPVWMDFEKISPIRPECMDIYNDILARPDDPLIHRWTELAGQVIAEYRQQDLEAGRMVAARGPAAPSAVAPAATPLAAHQR